MVTDSEFTTSQSCPRKHHSETKMEALNFVREKLSFVFKDKKKTTDNRGDIT